MARIVNTLGHFVAVEDNFHHTINKRSTRVPVQMDITVELPPDIDIICNDIVHSQILDYLTCLSVVTFFMRMEISGTIVPCCYMDLLSC